MEPTVVATNERRSVFRVAPTANGPPPLTSLGMSWAVWLLIPVALTTIAAIASWLRHRPPRPPDTARAMREHSDFLDALVQTARSKDRGDAGSGD
jgi:hypothetical protein